MRIGIVNESPQEIAAFRQLLERTGQHRIVWVAAGGQEAIMRCARDTPDLMLLELHLSTMNGITTTRRIMRESPCPILITTAALDNSSAQVFEALGAGALDVACAPVPGGSENQNSPAAFLAKVERLARLLRPAAAETSFISRPVKPVLQQTTPLVAIGCSAGGPAAVATVLGGLPPEFPAGVIVVQHLDEQFAPGLAAWLNQRSQLPVRVAREGDRPTPGLVQLANAADHLVLLNADTLGYQVNPREVAYRPSIDVFYESVVRHWPGQALGVLLTGMGHDGAAGLKALRDAGHHTLVQDQASCAVYGMPKAAASLNAAAEILPLERIAQRLRQHVQQPTP